MELRLPHLHNLLPSLLLFLCAALSAPAIADIMISPTRAILDDENRQMVLTLRNPGEVARSYRLRWSERRMDDNGSLVQVEEGKNPSSAARLVRFSPRRIVVGPGQIQTVRLDYNPPANLPVGEYRSHLVIGLEPEQSGTAVIDEKSEGVTVKLQALISFSLPVVVRHGSGNAVVSILSVAPDRVETAGETEAALKVVISRTGSFGAYGQIKVYQQLDANAPVTEIGRAGNVAIYAESTQGAYLVPLKKDVDLRKGSWLRVTYESDSPKGQILAEQTLQIGS